jgi:hypothetical protein
MAQFQAQKTADSAVSGSMGIPPAAQWHFPGNYLEVDPAGLRVIFHSQEMKTQHRIII